jgi:anaerobic ribonucleoside-triphosphate reductase
MTVYLKSCNRCGGDMNSNRDIYGEYRVCMQCGNMVDIPNGSNLFSLQGSMDNTNRKKAA